MPSSVNVDPARFHHPEAPRLAPHYFIHDLPPDQLQVLKLWRSLTYSKRLRFLLAFADRMCRENAFYYREITRLLDRTIRRA